MKILFALKNYFVVACVLGLTACGSPSPKEQTKEIPTIFPDYCGTTVPVNIAPLNFKIHEAEKITARFCIDQKELYLAEGSNTITIPESKWKELTTRAQGKQIDVQVDVWNNQHKDGIRYQPFAIHVTSDSITPWIAYRLIPPGYVQWKEMGIYQRNLESFDEECIVSNTQNNEGCVNCHTFHNYSPDLMLFHARGKNGCSVLVEKGEPKRLELDKLPPHFKGTYPYWHPNGRFLVLSNCDTHQGFYGHSRNKIEVYDLDADLMIYDRKNQQVITDPRFTEKEYWETFPSFSPDGKSLFICRAKACTMPIDYEKLKYALLRYDFDPNTGKIGATADTIYNPELENGSASFPRVSPDGKRIMYTVSGCGTFPIWHKDADLCMKNLKTGEKEDISILNSPDVESYHSWDRSGHWVIFSSRRIDGRYTRLFLAHYNPEQGFSKPFLLPQKDPEHNTNRLYSYNIPEFISLPVRLSKEKTAKLFQ